MTTIPTATAASTSATPAAAKRPLMRNHPVRAGWSLWRGLALAAIPLSAAWAGARLAARSAYWSEWLFDALLVGGLAFYVIRQPQFAANRAARKKAKASR